MTTSPVNTSNAAGTTPSAAPPAQGVDALANKETFLQLLVAQIRNQDPLNPTDGTQFVSQLAQFSELEQMINIRQDVQSIQQQITQPSTAGGGN